MWRRICPEVVHGSRLRDAAVSFGVLRAIDGIDRGELPQKDPSTCATDCFLELFVERDAGELRACIEEPTLQPCVFGCAVWCSQSFVKEIFAAGER